MVSCFEVVPTDSKQVLDRTVNREKTLSLWASDEDEDEDEDRR